MTKPFRGVINVDVTKSVPDWEPCTQPIAPEGTPSVPYIVLDDAGYSAMAPYGGLIETPNIDRIAQRGLTYTDFHTTALGSPTRSCLMTGRDHTTNGMAEPLPAGRVVLSASFGREGDSMPAGGTLIPPMDEREAGRGRIRTQPGTFSIAGERLNIGKDAGEPVTDDYPGRGPCAFTGGTIHRAAVDVSGEPFADLAAEARMAFMRD